MGKSTIKVTHSEAVNMLADALCKKILKIAHMTDEELGNELEIQMDETHPLNNWMVVDGHFDEEG